MLLVLHQTIHPAPGPLASISLYNPTRWEGPAPVQVPVGRLATPGLVNWDEVRLVHDGREVPFAIREGRPHWKSHLTAPVRRPRAEDLLVFSCAVPPSTWTRLDVVRGPRRKQIALARKASRLIISYPGLSVAINETTGVLAEIEAWGESMLQAPLAVEFYRTGGGTKGNRQPLGSSSAALISSSSAAAMTELNFVLDSGDRPAMALTYRVHSSGLVEIECDERPWQDTSPWLAYGVDYTLALAGEKETLPLLVNRAPFYGFKDYTAVVRHIATIHRARSVSVLELGEEIVNGRRWNRRLYVIPNDKSGKAREMVELADEGLIVDATPMYARLPGKGTHLSYPDGAQVPAEVLAEALRQTGLEATAVSEAEGTANAAVVLKLVREHRVQGIEGDGFEIRPQQRGAGVSIAAQTRFGLMQAALRVARCLGEMKGATRLPLIASNPAVDLRAGGFGGGDFEVDFPYGSDADWEEAFEGLMASGMNVMADLGMWSNWKMPVTYKYMPELRSDSPEAYDEVSGARFSEIARHREHGLRLLSFLHDRGVRVWLWIPIGAVPTTYAQKHPEAMSPQSDRYPCFTHPLYNRYLESFAKELLETYPIDGVVMIRDDNGGICQCERCKAYVAQSRTRSPVWEQYVLLYDWLRKDGFRGDIAVYPYNDAYEPRLDPLLPRDLFIVGHGSGAALLSRHYERLGPMGDTWLDNLFASFRVAPTPRMKRLLADRGSFWIGGAYCGTELPWEAIGFFGWEPTATVNSFRYHWGTREFGKRNALAYVKVSDPCECLWDLYDLPMLPLEWVKLSAEDQRRVAQAGGEWLERFRARLEELRSAADDKAHAAWFAHVRLFGTYFEYHLRRLELFSEMLALVRSNQQTLSTPDGLPQSLREKLIALHRDIYDSSSKYDREASAVPGNMMARIRANQMTSPFKEWVGGYDLSLESVLEVKQFAGTMEVSPTEVTPGREFVLRVRLRNTGVCPWMPGVGHRLEVGGDAQRLGLPTAWDYTGEWTVFGDRREVELRGVAPREPGEAELNLRFFTPFRNSYAFIKETAKVRWR